MGFNLASFGNHPSTLAMAGCAEAADCMRAGRHSVQFLAWSARVGAVIVALIGAAVMIGWLADIAFLKSVLPGLATMKFNTACALLMAGVALWLLQSSSAGSQSRRVARVLGGLVVAIGGLTLLQYVFAIDLGIDQLIVADISSSAHRRPDGAGAPPSVFSASGSPYWG